MPQNSKIFNPNQRAFSNSQVECHDVIRLMTTTEIIRYKP